MSWKAGVTGGNRAAWMKCNCFLNCNYRAGKRKRKHWPTVINGGEQSFPVENLNSLGIGANNTSSSKERVGDGGAQGKITSSEVL